MRIWSAACCTGEEPYTIAVILSRLLPDWREWDLSILGTDINAHFLKIAAEGVYRNWSFRATPASTRERYFTPTADGYAIDPEIKQMVKFTQHNLADASYAPVTEDGHNIDIIFCRNALMYFSPEGVARTAASFHNVLADGGWLVVNPSEASPALFSQYEVVSQPDVILFRRRTTAVQRSQKLGTGIQNPSNPQSAFVLHSQTQNPRNPQVPRPQLPRPQTAPVQQIPAGAWRHEKQVQGGGWEDAHALQGQGRQTEAREKLLALVEQGTNDTRVFAMLASIEADLGQLSAALEWSERTTRTDRMNPAHWYLRATILQERGDLDEAITALKRVLYLDPDFVLARFVLGNMTMQQGRKPEALRHFNIAHSQLSKYERDDILAGSDDLTANQLETLIAAMLDQK